MPTIKSISYNNQKYDFPNYDDEYVSKAEFNRLLKALRDGDNLFFITTDDSQDDIGGNWGVE